MNELANTPAPSAPRFLRGRFAAGGGLRPQSSIRGSLRSRGYLMSHCVRFDFVKKSENFKSGYPDIRIARNIRTHEMIIHTKFQHPNLKTVACYRGQMPLPFGKYIVRSYIAPSSKIFEENCTIL